MWRRFEVLLAVWGTAWGASGACPVLWAPAPDASAPATRVRATVRFDLPAASCGDLPAPPSGARGGLARVQKTDGTCAYCGWTAGGWIELAGSEAGADPVEVEMLFGDGTVVYRAGGVPLTAVTSGAKRLATGTEGPVGAVDGMGEGRVDGGVITGSCLDCPKALATADGRVAVADGTPTGVHPLVSERGAEWFPRITVEGPADRLCTVVPSGGDGLDVRVEPLPYDDGRHVLNVTVSPQTVGFVRALSDGLTGTDHRLYLNGGGRLVVQGDSRVSGGIVVEDGVVEVRSQPIETAASDVLLWSDTAFALASAVDRLDLVERVVTHTDPTGKVVRRTAFAPILSTGSEAGKEPAFALGADVTDGFRTVTFRIANATKGFLYACASTPTLDEAFRPCGAAIVATQDGAIELKARVPADASQRFFRLSVGLPPPNGM